MRFGNIFFQSFFRNNKDDDSTVWEQNDNSTASDKGKVPLAGIIISAVFLFIALYFMYVPLNIRSVNFWVMLIILSLPICINLYVKLGSTRAKRTAMLVPVALIVAAIVAGICGAKIFHAHGYASVISIKDADFEEDLQQTLSTDSIALMDTDSAKMLGDREIGTLSGVVSQYNVSTDYAQIDYQGSPVKVSELEYAGFWKWWNNRSNGVPGYITVDPVSMSASYDPLDVGMVYVPSAYFFQTAERRIYFHYPTKITGDLHFEVDEEGNPYYITTVYEPTIGLFQAQVPKGAIIMDPTTGDMDYYTVDEVPQWVDIVYTGSNICEYYDWYGLYSNGFWNSLFGKQGCKQITTYSRTEMDDDPPAVDYGYVAKDGDIWIYTGVTSINNDSSNIGFILSDERTGETHYYTIAGADEQSAMNAAEGEVQEKGYQSSFPSLINVDGTPTYIMVMKDASGLVKLYAAVNVEQYNIVATASTQEECINQYRMLLHAEETEGLIENVEDTTGVESVPTDSDVGTGTAESNDTDTAESVDTNPVDTESTDISESSAPVVDESAPSDEADITVASIQFIDINGNTYCYLITEDQEIYKISVADHEDILLVGVGDRLHISHQNGTIVSWSLEQ
ncbi:MAG: hypothetical protein LIO56_04980 [Lachnospiraceae bacterium]|nr:hypothetical protein [Lachnospiraceae bacterium]